MRKLGLKDAFALARIIKSANIRDEIAAFGLEVRELQKAEKSANVEEKAEKSANVEEKAEKSANVEEKAEKSVNVEEIGIKFLITVATSISDGKIEKQFYKLYADVKGVEADEIGMYDISTIRADITELVEINDLKSFFNSLSALMSKQ